MNHPYRTVIETGQTVEYMQEPIRIDYSKHDAPLEFPDKVVLKGTMPLTFWTDKGWQALYLISDALIYFDSTKDEMDNNFQRSIIERNIWKKLGEIMKEGQFTINAGQPDEETLKFYSVARHAIIFKEPIQ